MNERTMPSSNGKNPTNSVVKWFYEWKYGMKADATLYARHNKKSNPKAICWLFNKDEELDNAIYEPMHAAMLIYYLEDRGVDVDDLSILMVPGLMASFVLRNSSNDAAKELTRLVKYLKGEAKDDSAKSSVFSAPAGW